MSHNQTNQIQFFTRETAVSISGERCGREVSGSHWWCNRLLPTTEVQDIRLQMGMIGIRVIPLNEDFTRFHFTMNMFTNIF